MKTMTLSNGWYYFLLIFVISYLIGCINFAIFISKIKNHGEKDIRSIGSGNPGMLNMSRAYGMKIGVLILFLDIMKGVVPCLTVKLIFRDIYYGANGICLQETALALAGFGAVTGHVFPFWLKFKGGKGISTTIGVFLVAQPLWTVIFGLSAIAFILLTNMGSMGSFIATTPSAIATCYSYYLSVVADKVALNWVFYLTQIIVMLIIVVTWWAHRVNISRLLKGEEHPTNWLQMIKNMKFKSRLKKEKNK